MKFNLFIIVSIFLTLNLFGQKSEIENLINQIAYDEVPESFDYYFLVPKSLEQPKIYDSIQNYHIEEFRTKDKDTITALFYQKAENEIEVDWNNYNLEKAKCVNYKKGDYQPTSPPTRKNIQFVRYNIGQKEYDSLTKNRKPHTIVVKKKWLWRKNRFWENKKLHNELIKAWEIDEAIHKEEKFYFSFSKPLFSKDKKYARISIFINRRCDGYGFTAIYKKDNGIWKRILDYNYSSSLVMMTHASCGDILISYYD